MPVFQPGTVTLFSGVKRSCPLEVFAKNCGQNGPVLGMSCSLFLAKFMAHMAFKYEENMKNAEKNPKEFDPEIYHNSLIQMLDNYSEEDADQHGRLLELKKLCLDVNNAEKIDISEEDEKKFMKNDYRVYKEKMETEDKDGVQEVRKRFEYYSDWEKLFHEESASKIHQTLLPKIEKEILMKKNIFPNPNSYEILENHFEFLKRQLEQFDEFDKSYVRKMSRKKKIEMERKQLEEFRKKKRQGKGGKKKGGRKKKAKAEEEEAPEEEKEEVPEDEEKTPEDEAGEGEEEAGEGGEEEQQPEPEEEKDPFAYEENPEDNQKFHVQNQYYYFDYGISCNTRLCDYFNSGKRGLRSLFVCGKITETVHICPKAISTYDIMSSLSSIFPIYGHILSSSNLELGKMRDKNLRNILGNLTTLGVAYDDLAHHVAKGLTISRRNVLTTMNKLSDEQVDRIGPAIVKVLRDSDFSDHQILGIVDSKYAEAAAIKFMYDETLSYSKKMKVIFFFFNFLAWPYRIPHRRRRFFES